MTANWMDEGFNHRDVGLELVIWIPALFCKVHRPLIFVLIFDHMWHWRPRTTERCLLQTITPSLCHSDNSNENSYTYTFTCLVPARKVAWCM